MFISLALNKLFFVFTNILFISCICFVHTTTSTSNNNVILNRADTSFSLTVKKSSLAIKDIKIICQIFVDWKLYADSNICLINVETDFSKRLLFDSRGTLISMTVSELGIRGSIPIMINYFL